MTLGDSGPLVALINTADANYQRCQETLPLLSGPIIVTWPCLTEAMYLLGRTGGYPAQRGLWQLFERQFLVLHLGSEAERLRAQELMARYRDAPMDLADASVVAAAETLEIPRVFTLDRHFYAYRFRDREHFEVLP